MQNQQDVDLENGINSQSIEPTTSAPNELTQWFQDLKQGYQKDSHSDFKIRKSYLLSLKTQLIRYQDLLTDAMDRDFNGRSKTESVMADILGPILDINHVMKHLKSWMKPSRRSTEWIFKGNKLKVIYQPKGVVGIICPWNFPLYLSIGPLTTALAAGNRCMIKMPPNCPQTTQVLTTMLGEVFPPDLVRVVAGDHPNAMDISHLPFDHLIFTGSPNSGKTIMANAAENLTPVTLELGGKSPAIVFDDYDIKKAAKRITHGKSFNSGQICIAPDYAFVPEVKIEQFVKEVQLAYKKMYKKKLDGNKDYTSLVDDAQHKRFHELLEDAKQKGAEITQCLDYGDSRKTPLFIVTKLTSDMQICQEEIFGPLLPVHPYQSIEQVCDYINGRPRPLACYLFSDDNELRNQVLNNTHSGGVTINDWGWHALNHAVPFGGIGNSGIGNYHGIEGFRELSHARSVLQMRGWFPIQLFAPPYNKFLQKMVVRAFVGKADKSLKIKSH